MSVEQAGIQARQANARRDLPEPVDGVITITEDACLDDVRELRLDIDWPDPDVDGFMRATEKLNKALSKATLSTSTSLLGGAEPGGFLGLSCSRSVVRALRHGSSAYIPADRESLRRESVSWFRVRQ